MYAKKTDSEAKYKGNKASKKKKKNQRKAMRSKRMAELEEILQHNLIVYSQGNLFDLVLASPRRHCVFIYYTNTA